MNRYLLLLGFVAALGLFGYATHIPASAAFAALATLVCMALPGLVIVRWMLSEEQSALLVYVFGVVLGLFLGRLLLAAVGLGFGLTRLNLVLLMGGMAVPSMVYLICRRPLPAWNQGDAREAGWLLGVLALVFAAMAIPYWGVGRLTSDGYTFVPYFDRDYLNHISLTAELSRCVPPQNPFFAGTQLHYYWSYHLWPAAIMNLSNGSARDALNVSLLPTVGLFVASLSLWVRTYVAAPWPRRVAIGIALFAYSYIGILFLLKLASPGMARFFPTTAQVEYSFLSHSWFRDFLYEPHAVTCLTLLLFILVYDHTACSSLKPLPAAVVGLIFGAMLVTDAFIGLLGLLWFTSTHLVPFFRNSRLRGPLLISAACTILIVIMAIGLGVFPLGRRVIWLAAHSIVKFAPAYLLIELGPLFVLGMLGMVVLARARRLGTLTTALILLGLALAVGFFLRVPHEHNIVLRKAIKVAQLPLVVLTALALATLACSSRKVLLLGAVALVALPGMSTLGTDIAQYLDYLRSQNPPTTYISPNDMDMLDWVRTHTPTDCIIQTVNPGRLFGDHTELVIPGLGQRRMFYGNDEMPDVFQVPLAEINARKEMLMALHAATSGAEATCALAGFPKLYLYVDEEATGPVAALRELEDSGILHEVHRAGSFSLLQMAGQATRDQVVPSRTGRHETPSVPGQ